MPENFKEIWLMPQNSSDKIQKIAKNLILMKSMKAAHLGCNYDKNESTWDVSL